MVRRSPGWLVGCALLGAVPAQGEGRLDLSTMLLRQARVDWLWRAPAADERCVQFSSYDRRSDGGPEDPGAWYANNDRGNYLRVERGPDGAEHVLVDVQGPGCLARLWSANPSGTLHFDVDGERVWSVDFAKLCAGAIEGVPAQLAAMRARGGNVYLPILFAQRLEVSSTQADLYYLADVVRFPEAVEVESFAPAQLREHRGVIAQAAAGELEQDGWMSTWYGEVPARSLVRAMSVSVEGPAAAQLEVLRRARLVVRCGAETTVDVPVLAFFATGPDGAAWEGALLGRWSQGVFYSKFPMPFPDGGSIDVVVDGDDRGVSFKIGLSVALDAVNEQALRFRAGYHLVKGQPTRPFSEHRVLAARGRGRLVGCSLLVRNPTRVWWGEGDEKIYVDGEEAPSWFGTGTEDYFGYAWCDPTPFEAPFHAQVQCEGPINYGFTQLHRTHVLDSVPFQRALRFDLERWHWVPDAVVDYETVAYWYGDAGATSGLPPVPSVEERQLEHLPVPRMRIVAGALEGETLSVRSCSGGTHEVQNLSFFEGKFSRDAHRWWRDGAVGDRLVLEVPVRRAGDYRVTLGWTQANDFGKVRATLAGRPLGEVFNGYAPAVQPSAPFDGGTLTLSEGTQPLVLELVGRDPRALPRMMVGLDYVKLEALK